MRLRADELALPRLASSWVDIGRRSALSYSLRRQWLYRRVESITFVDRGSAERHVSVDLEIPRRLPLLGQRGPVNGHLIPISVFPKWPPLMNFDLHGPDGRSASLYVRDTNVALDFGLLLGLVELVHQGLLDTSAIRPQYRGLPLALPERQPPPALPILTGPPPALQELLAWLIAADEPPTRILEVAIRDLTADLQPALHSSDPALAGLAADTIDLAAQLANSSILWIPLQGSPGTDRVAKFSYLDTYHAPRSRFRRLVIACSWAEDTLFVPLRHAGQHTRYHLEVIAPSGLEITVARTAAFPGAWTATSHVRQPSQGSRSSVDTAPDAGVGTQDKAASLDRAEAQPGRSDESPPPSKPVIIGHQAHLYHAFRESLSHRMYLKLRLSTSRDGFISACAIASAVIAAVMTVAFWWIAEIDVHLDATVVLLAVVPVVLGYVLVRPAANSLERDHLMGVRAMSLLSGSMPILGALVLVLTRAAHSDRPDIDVVRPIWAGLVIASWLLVAGLGLSWLFAAKFSSGESDRRWTRLVLDAGIFLMISITSGVLLEWQPFSHVRRSALMTYLQADRPRVLIGSSLVAGGAVALYTVLGGLWRAKLAPEPDGDAVVRHPASVLWVTVCRGARNGFLRTVIAINALARAYPQAVSPARLRLLRKLGRRVPAGVVICSGIAWIWGTLAVTTLTAWQALVVSPRTNGTKLDAFAHAVDVVADVTLVPASVFMFSSVLWLLWRRTIFDDPLERFLVCASGVIALTLCLVRLISLVWDGYGHVSPRPAWIGFAVWIGVLGCVLQRPLRRPTPAGGF
jgi:hypothetical protein